MCWITVHRRRDFGWLALQFMLKSVSKNPRAFGIFVEGNLLSNFGIQSLEHFCLKIWRKFILKRAMWNSVWIRANPRTTSPARPPRRLAVPGPRAHAKAPEDPTVWGPCRRHCAPTTNDAREGLRPVPRGLCALASGRTAIRYWPPVHRTSPPPPRPCLSPCRPWSEALPPRWAPGL
jgi:hypothetical protein